MDENRIALTADALLIDLMNDCGCLYLSDLYTSTYRYDVNRFIEKVEVTNYSSVQWAEAYQYITREQVTKQNGEEIRRKLLEKLVQ